MRGVASKGTFGAMEIASGGVYHWMTLEALVPWHV